ncbi:hypothetical protein Q5752_002062 [Cryptotrichosporon argae]
MYDTEYDDEVRKQAVMAEVLPDAEMWRKWEKTEAPLRQGRGWYPTLDRHFLELLVVSEIQTLAHPLQAPAPPPGPSVGLGIAAQAERIHRHAGRVRRVASERIGAERLHAYCERVREAYDAYAAVGWRGIAMPEHDDDETDAAEGESEGEGEEDEVRGRSEIRRADGALARSDRALSPRHGTGSPAAASPSAALDAEAQHMGDAGLAALELDGGMCVDLCDLGNVDEREEDSDGDGDVAMSSTASGPSDAATRNDGPEAMDVDAAHSALVTA